MCSLRPQGPARFGGNARRAPQPAPLSRGQLHVQPKTAGPGAFWRQRQAGPQPAPLPRGRFIHPNHLRRLPVCTETLASIPSRWGNWKTQSADSVWEPTGGLPGATSTRTLMGNGVRMGRLMQAGGSTSGHPFIRDHVVTQALGELW